MFWNRRMFWKVRPIPAATMSLGRALRKTPSRARRVVYQAGRTIADDERDDQRHEDAGDR